MIFQLPIMSFTLQTPWIPICCTHSKSLSGHVSKISFVQMVYVTAIVFLNVKKYNWHWMKKLGFNITQIGAITKQLKEDWENWMFHIQISDKRPENYFSWLKFAEMCYFHNVWLRSCLPNKTMTLSLLKVQINIISP